MHPDRKFILHPFLLLLLFFLLIVTLRDLTIGRISSDETIKS